MSESLTPRRFEGLHDEDQETDPESLYSDEKFVPFDEELHSEEGRTKSDLLTDNIGLVDEASSAMSIVLNSIETGILEMRYLDDEPKTLEQIGKKLGLTGEGVRLIETKALQKLKAYLNKEIPISNKDLINLKSHMARIPINPPVTRRAYRRKISNQSTNEKKEKIENKFIKDFNDSAEGKEIVRYFEGKHGLQSVISTMLIDVHNNLYKKTSSRTKDSENDNVLQIWERSTEELFSLITGINRYIDPKKEYTRDHLIFLFDKAIEATEFIIGDSDFADSKSYLALYLDKFKKFRDSVGIV